MSNAIFPSLPGLTWNITRAPKFATKVQEAVGGRVIRAAFQAYPIWRWTLEYEFLRTYAAYVEWQTLLGFFNSRQGSFDSFLFSDPEDKTVTGQLIGAGTGSLTTFQLGRTLGGFFEPIYNPDSTTAAPKIYKNGVLQVLGADYTISSSALVTFTSPPAAALPITWDGDYYWRVNFEADSSQFDMFAQHFWRNRQIALVSALGA